MCVFVYNPRSSLTLLHITQGPIQVPDERVLDGTVMVSFYENANTLGHCLYSDYLVTDFFVSISEARVGIYGNG